MPEPSRPQAIEDHFHNRVNQASARIPHALQSFARCHNRVFEVLFHSSSRVLYFFPKCCLCVLGHEDSLSCLLPPSFSKGPSLFDFHLASLLPLPYSFLCSARAILSNRCPQYLCGLPGKRLANQRQPKVVSTCPPQYDPHVTSVARSLARSGSGEASERASATIYLMNFSGGGASERRCHSSVRSLARLERQACKRASDLIIPL